ncbi:MAG: nodulation protein NfeD [Desulfonauticus sp.]|nr:nodulation protein NfeD [Desulfonauticus sp.]
MKTTATLLIFYVIVLFNLPAQAEKVMTIPLKGAITPVMEQILNNGLSKAQKESCKAVILLLDTPGGFISSMRKMVKSILNTPLPVIVYVSPKGAQAASAGIFLVASADIAVMSPQTIIGAASPVQITGEDLQKTMRQKIEQDLLSLLYSLCVRNQRNFSVYNSFVLQAKSLSANQALKQKVIDFVAISLPNLLKQLQNKQYHVKGQNFRLTRPELIQFEPGVVLQFLSYILHPQIAYFLFIGGLLGLFFELSQPGAILPGVLGSIFLLLGLYALSILPTNLTGILLILLGTLFFGLELKFTSYGLLSLAGIISLFLGSLLFYAQDQSFLNWTVKNFFPGTIILILLLGGIVVLVAKSQLKTPSNPVPVGKIGEVVYWQGKKGQIKVQGELWQAKSKQEENFCLGDEVFIIGHRGLVLEVTKNQPQEA